MRRAIRILAAATALAAVTLLASANAATIASTERAAANTAAWRVPGALIADGTPIPDTDGDIFPGQGDVNSPLGLATDPGPNQLPEPGTLLLLGAGLLVLGLIQRRRRS
jgi:hypothetical protein